MKQVTVNIPDSKFEFIMKLFKELGIKTEKAKQADWYDNLTEDQKNAIAKGIDDIENGKTHTSEDVRKSIRQRIENKSA